MRKLLFSAFTALLFLGSLSCTKESSQSVKSSAVSSVKKSGMLGRQQQITIPTGDYTYPTSQALLWLPGCYNNEAKSQKTFPLIIALDGIGEQGTDINALFHTGTIAKRIADGWNATAVNPANGRTFKFIVFTPQCPVQWGWSSPQIKTMLANLEANYRIDVNRVYITGYSAGGWGLWSCITDDEGLCKQFAAIGPISSASADHPDKISNVDKYGIACWSICGTADAFYTNSINYTNIINSNQPVVPATLTGLEGVGHSAWYQAYDPNWRVNNKNFFEWLLQYHK